MAESTLLILGGFLLVLGAFFTAVGLLLWPLLCLSLPLGALGLVLLIVGAVKGRSTPQTVIYATHTAPVGRYCEKCGQPMALHAPSGQYWCGPCGRWAKPLI